MIQGQETIVKNFKNQSENTKAFIVGFVSIISNFVHDYMNKLTTFLR